MKSLKKPTPEVCFIIFSGIAGLLLRVLFVQDMEYKEDEAYNFTQTQLIGVSQPWPWVGIPSGVYLVNPGMSIWVFTVLAKFFNIHQPTALATAVQLFAWLGIALIIPFALKWVKDQQERMLWLWAYCIAMVNPFLILYQRKLWPEPFLPFFTMLTFAGWWNRSKRWGAGLWGLIGACLGQIHMSGFFFSFALFIWTLCFDSKLLTKENKSVTLDLQREPGVQWRYWFLGSVVGALPLIPWALYVAQNPTHQRIGSGWDEMIQLKYWMFWISNPVGLHLGNTLGILRGPTQWDQLSDFIRYPILGSFPTYINGFAHVILLGVAAWIFCRGISTLFKNSKLGLMTSLQGLSSNTLFVQNAIFLLCGILMTVTGIAIRRYYLNVTFPLEFIFLARLAQPHTKVGKNLLITAWVAQLIIAANFVGYIHVNHGSPQGDYGPSYSAQ